MNIKKILSVAMIAVMTVGIFAGCQSSPTGQTQSQQTQSSKTEVDKTENTSKDPGEVTVFTYPQRGEDTNFGTLYKKFTEETGIKVVLQSITGDMNDYEKKIDISLMSGDRTDVFFTTNPITHAKYVLNGSLLALNDIAKQSNYDLDAKYGKYLVKYDDKVYGIPSSPTFWAVFYNKKIFDDAGVPYPKGYWTWDQYVETAKKLTDPAKKIYGSFMNTFDANSYFIANQKGVDGYKKDGTSNFDDQAFVDSLKFYGSLGNTLKVQPSYLEYTSKKLPAESFVLGNYAMCFTGTWLISSLSDTTKYPRDWDWGITQAPVPDENSKNNIGGLGFSVVNKNAKDQENAFKFVTFVAENQYKYTNELPALNNFNKDDYLKLFQSIAEKSNGSVTTEDLYNALIDNGLGFRPEKITGSIPAQYKAIILKDVSLYYAGQKSAEDVCNEIKKEADQAIKEASQK